MNHNQNQTWGTWDELLLACAVKRHGSKNWDSVAMEVQTRSTLPQLLTTAKKCENKYQDLKRRFRDNDDGEETKEGDDDTIPWLEELRKSRVAELRREVQRYDVSILSLQLKVKRLEEEREEKPDLEIERSETDKKDEPKGSEPETKTEKAVSGEESDRENRSVNESNSTGGVKVEPGPVQTGSGEPDPVQSGSDPKELGESVSELSGGDVQSSASLGRKRKRKERRRKKEVGGGGGGDGIVMKRGGDGDDDVKSEPLVGFLEMIRAHQHGSFFERRLQSQETEEYKNIVRQHVDLETIQTRLDQGSYSSSTLAFYRDLMLLTNNAIVFFPKSSLESINAHELRNLVSNEMKKETQKSDSSQEQSPLPAIPPPQPKPELERLDSLLERQKSSAPIIVCRKRSSVSAKPSSNLGQKVEQQISDDKNPVLDIKPPVEESLLKMKAKEKPVTGARSSRRSNKNTTTTNNSSTNISTPNKKQNANSGSKTGSADKQETLKSDKKKTEALASDKKRSVVDFLKRIKKNSPAAQTSKKSTRGGGSSSGGNGGGEEKKTRSNNSNKGDKGKERVLRRSGDKKKVKEEISPSKRVGRPPKKGAEVSVVTGKRRRESGGGGKEVKQQRKRARR